MEINATTAGSSGNTAALRTLTDDFDTFLTLLTTQLQNQDPLDPMDSSEFTNQLVMFSDLEQQITQTGKLEDILAAQTAAQAAAAVGYLGKTIQAKAPFTALDSGSATIPYTLPAGATTASIAILDDNGSIIYTEQLDPTPGAAEFIWDGIDRNGTQQPDGNYGVSLVALDENNVPVNGTTTLFTATADEVVTENGTLLLRMNGIGVPLSDIVSIKSNI